MSSKLDTDNGSNTPNTSGDSLLLLLLCEECQSEKFKYKCPACSRRTCSLPCVNSHKKSSGCTGKKDVAVFLPLSQFDDSTLVSDYNLLEDIKRVAESSQRMRTQILCNSYYEYRLPGHLKALLHAASKRRTQLLFFPPGMSKRQKNQTRLVQRPRLIKWTVEWRFHSTDVALLEHMVNENSTLRSEVEKHLQPSPWRNKLRRFTEATVDNLKFYIRINQKYIDSSYRQLDLDTPLRELFSGLTILEYPIIQIYLPSEPCNLKVVNDLKRTGTKVKSKEPIPDDTPTTPVVICSKEEEIVEEESPEPKIFDFLDKSIKELPNNLPTGGNVPDANNVERSTQVEMLDASIDDFDFDQELIDVYSSLIEQGMEELEEGEIPTSD